LGHIKNKDEKNIKPTIFNNKPSKILNLKSVEMVIAPTKIGVKLFLGSCDITNEFILLVLNIQIEIRIIVD
jgi:hypothetical protein